MTLGEKIKKLREDKGLTQNELALVLGVQKSAISKYENGRVENLKYSTYKTIVVFFGVSANYLMDDERK